ncbi:F-box only protein 15 [Polypterus senegalus]|uniref:F-box only protein 15 n=1 Tax=Polypterus senegalus TaxID=55291 RepID=UPI001962E0C1|nr:F-box only protein 15 [Polypterus senegalus]
MATGRSRMKTQKAGLAERGSLRSLEELPSTSSGRDVAPASRAHERLFRQVPGKRMIQSIQKPRSNIESLFPEILLKIVSYLDASSLMSLSCVNKTFKELANSNAVWYKMYTSSLPTSRMWKRKDVEIAGETRGATSVYEKPDGFWKCEYIRKMVINTRNKLKNQLKDINPYTGLPTKTKQVLRDLQIKWKISVTGKENQKMIEHSNAYLFDSTITIFWNTVEYSCFDNITMIHLYAIVQMPLGSSTANRCGWPSLLSTYDLADQKSAVVIGSDKLIKVVLLPPGLLIGVWKDSSAVAFFMASLHFHKLIEKCTLGTLSCPYTEPMKPPVYDDIDPENGLHGYKLHFELHDARKQFMSGCFSQLFCRKNNIQNGFLRVSVIDIKNLSQHIAVSGKVGIKWNTEALKGIIQDSCFMDLTVLDEAQNPFWCVSTPVSLKSSHQSIAYDYVGQYYIVSFQDSCGKVQMELVWLEEQEQFFIITLVLYISTEKVNMHFGTQY